MTLLQRLGLVAWWFGAILGALIWGIAVWILIAQEGIGPAAGWAAFSCVMTAACWSVAFVLGGSFWRPPR